LSEAYATWRTLRHLTSENSNSQNFPSQKFSLRAEGRGVSIASAFFVC
jgi:hypothetical protein